MDSISVWNWKDTLEPGALHTVWEAMGEEQNSEKAVA